jgi:hypothetical protein
MNLIKLSKSKIESVYLNKKELEKLIDRLTEMKSKL